MQHQTPFLGFTMTMSETVSMMSINIDEIVMDMDIKVLMTLSTLALADEDYIREPQPVMKVEKQQQPQLHKMQ
jgi:hypothetical protein